MKINMHKNLYKGCVFLGGTCEKSTWRNWRSKLIEKLDLAVPYFDPQVEKWNEVDAAREKAFKSVARFNVFVITGDAFEIYPDWKIYEEANKDASKLIFCTIEEVPENQFEGISKIKKRLTRMGATVCKSLDEIAAILNEAYAEKQ